MQTGVKVSDAMTRNPVVVGPELSLKQCATTMIKNRVGSVLVKQSNKLLGIVTAKDFVRATSNGADYDEVKVKDIMVRSVKTIKPNDDIYTALMRMSKGDIRRLPVVNNKKVVGLLTISDVLKLQPKLLDLLSEKYRIGSRPRKMAERYLEGECEVCGNYAQLYDVSSKLVCEACKDQV